jgi:hypothetical protein
MQNQIDQPTPLILNKRSKDFSYKEKKPDFNAIISKYRK